MGLPLPLVPFESYMLADDRPAYPMTMLVRLRFCGRIERTALETALSMAVSRHPLLAAVARRSGRRWMWQPADRPPVLCRLDTPPAESLPPLPALDVRAEPGLRVASCAGTGRTDLTIQIHHACCDGLGLFRFAEDLLVCYAKVCGAAPDAALRALCPGQLHERGRFGLTAGKRWRMLSRQMVGLLGARQFLMRNPEPFVPHRPQPHDAPVPADYPASLTRQLTRTESEGLVAAARRRGVPTNDLLLRDFFLTANDWRRHAGADPGGWLRLTVPVNLRTIADRRLPAANVVSLVFLDRRARDMTDPQQLLDSIHREMALIKRLQLGLTFVLSLQVCQWLPGGLNRMTRANRCAATAVLTNLGAVLGRCPLPYRDGHLVAGEAVLQSIDALAPLRPLTGAAIVVLIYAGHLHITLHYDSRVLTATDARELMEGFTARVRQSADVREPLAAEASR